MAGNGKDAMIVIDNIKGMYTINYKCTDDGTYDTPKGLEEGDPWPECTIKPIDPCKNQKNIYHKVTSSRLSWLVPQSRIFRLFMKWEFDAYVL